MSDNFLSVPQVMMLKGIGAGDAARLAAKSQGVNLEDPYGVAEVSQQVIANLQAQGITPDPALVKSMAEQVLKSGLAGNLITKATDPVILPQPYVAPTDFAGQYP